MSKLKHIFLGLFILSFSQFLNAQGLFLRHYSVENGILSSEIYARLQDSLGYMWFATSRGISRFDGTRFVNYTVKNGLPTNSIITLFTDARKRVWFAGYDATLSYFNGKKIIPYRYNPIVQRLSKTFFINNLFFTNDSVLYFAPNLGGFFRIDKNGNVKDLLRDAPKYRFIIYQLGGQLFFIKNPTVKDTLTKVLVTDTAIFFNVLDKGLRRYIAKLRNGNFIFSIGRRLYLLYGDKIKLLRIYPHEISGIYVDHFYNLWISVLYTGVYFYRNSVLADSMLFLPHKSPIEVYQDNENAYWIPTTESGIYYLPGFNFYNYADYGFSGFNITAIAAQNNNLYFSTFDQQIFHCTTEKNVITSIENLNLFSSPFTVNDILATNNGIYFLGKGLVKYYKRKTYIILSNIWRGYSLAKTIDGNILATRSYGFIKICNDKPCGTYQNPDIPTSNSIYQSTDGTIWLGSINGLFSYSNGKLTFWGNLYKILKTRINNIAQYKHYILLATSGAGFIILDTISHNLQVFTVEDGLLSNFITKIFVYKNCIFLGTNLGLCKLVPISDKPLRFKIEKFSQPDGLFSTEIRDMAATNDSVIFLATSRGLVSFFPSKLRKQKINPKVIIDSILLDNVKVPVTSPLIIKAKYNDLTIFFKAISFRAGKNIIYRYKLQGYDNSWNLTRNRYIRFARLPGGNYKLFIEAGIAPNQWSKFMFSIDIVKKKRITETVWFYLVILITFFSGFSIVAHIILKRKQKELALQRRLLIAEQKALRSQMNPHFIFNALNSIRRFILENDMDKADYYLTSFAYLMRRVLDNSKQNFIPLSTEIETLRLYMELEKMRFDESFNFTLDVDPRIDLANWYLPPMVIQPFLENAIWHGLILKPKEGKLKVSFKLLDDNHILCVIEDNGIGRKKAMEIAAKRKGHKSTGLANTKERLSLLEQLYGKKISLKIIDLYDDNGQPAGTRVELVLPNYNDQVVA